MHTPRSSNRTLSLFTRDTLIHKPCARVLPRLLDWRDQKPLLDGGHVVNGIFLPSFFPPPPPPPPPFLSAPCHHGDPGNSSASSSNVLIMPRTISNTMVKPTPCRFVASLYSQVAVRFLLRQVHPLIRFPTTVPLRFFSFLLSFFIHSLSSLFFLFFSRFALD